MPHHSRLLVIDADHARACSLAELLAPAGYHTYLVAPGQTPAAAPDVVLLSLDEMSGSAVTRVAGAMPDADVLLLIGASALPGARSALRLGARDVVEREAGIDALLCSIERAARDVRNRRELAALRARVGEEARGTLVGQSSGMQLVRELVGRTAGLRRTALVTGEAGTGKSAVARLVHDLSERAASPFVVARCDGVPPEALEASLFGTSREGLLETARGGTLVLDEAHELPPAVYARLAATIAERVVRRAGGTHGEAVDVRLILTVRTTEQRPTVDAAAFFGDSHALPIALPPLRERRRDIPLLAQHFRERGARPEHGTLPPLSAETMASLLAHHWPGNVRELAHWMERIDLAADERGTTSRHVVIAPGAEFAPIDSARLTLAGLERRYILHVLAQAGGHQSRAADRLGIDRRTLYRKLKEYRDGAVDRAAS